MKKLLIYTFLCLFVSMNIFGSCEEEAKKKHKRIESAKRYFSKYTIYDNIDSSYTSITVYTGVIDGHKYRYHLFNGKNKSQMDVEHIKEECKACKKLNVK